MINRRSFFQMAAGVLGALAVPVPKVVWRWVDWESVQRELMIQALNAQNTIHHSLPFKDSDA